MQTLKFIADRFKLDLNQNSPIKVHMSRWHELGPLLNDLGFKKGVEIGVYRGRFTSRVAPQCPNMKWIGIDAWTVYKDYKDYCQTDLETEAEKAAIERVKNIKSVSLIKDWSVPASEKFEDGSLDFIFIDSNHTYEWVVEDLKAWAKKVRPGGIVMGHDYFVNRRFNFGVIEAVNGWVATHQINHLFKSKDQCPCWFYVQGDVSK